MKIKLIILLTIFIGLSSCVSKTKYDESQKALDSCNKELSNVLNKQKEIEKQIELLDSRNLCESNEAVVIADSKYKHLKKFAKIKLKVPIGQTSTNRKIEDNVITYITKVSKFKKDWKPYNDKIEFSKVYNSIKIIHIIIYDSNDECIDLLGEKHKTSVIQGTHPLIPDEDKK